MPIFKGFFEYHLPVTWIALASLIALLSIRRYLPRTVQDGVRIDAIGQTVLPQQLQNHPVLVSPDRYADSIWDISLSKLQPFDPNKVSQQELLAMGIPRSAAKRIVERREKWGNYKHPKQLMRVWGVPAAVGARISNAAHIERSPYKYSYFTPGAPLFPFNPNTVSAEALGELGFSQRAVEMIEKYRAKGGSFRKKEDFMRLYCVDSSTYQILEPYIVLPEAQSRKPMPYFAPGGSLFPFDPNTVSAESLGELGFSARAVEIIEKYRAKGGSFRKKEDFKRLYCVDSTTYQTLEPYITLPDTKSRKRVPYFTPGDSLFSFDPNTVSAESLRELGFSERAVGMIEKYRAKGGHFRKKEDFNRLYCVDSSTYQILKPYIVVE